jgi:hypothetical protein
MISSLGRVDEAVEVYNGGSSSFDPTLMVLLGPQRTPRMTGSLLHYYQFKKTRDLVSINLSRGCWRGKWPGTHVLTKGKGKGAANLSLSDAHSYPRRQQTNECRSYTQTDIQ